MLALDAALNLPDARPFSERDDRGGDFGLMVHLGGDRVRCVATMGDKAMADRIAWLWNHARDVPRKSVPQPPPPPEDIQFLRGGG